MSLPMVKAWLLLNKDVFITIAFIVGAVLLLVVAAPYCC